MNLSEALEQSFAELGLDLDSNSEDIPEEPVDSAEEPEAEDGPEEPEAVDEPDEVEDTDEDSDDNEQSDAPTLDIPEGAVLRLPDGTVVEADKAVLLQSDYTKKTQQVAEERKTLENERAEFETQRQQVAEAYENLQKWYEERQSDPTGWIQEIVESAPDPTSVLARAIYQLANAGKLDPAFVEAFGIDSGEVAQKATESKRDRELEELRKKVEQRENEDSRQAAIREQVAKYNAEWDRIKQDRGLSFENGPAEDAAKKELLQFAIDSKLTHSLVDAYDLMAVRRGSVQPVAEKAPEPDPQVTAKKRASRAVTQKSSAGSAPKSKRPASVREAALQSLDEFAAGAR